MKKIKQPWAKSLIKQKWDWISVSYYHTLQIEPKLNVVNVQKTFLSSVASFRIAFWR